MYDAASSNRWERGSWRLPFEAGHPPGRGQVLGMSEKAALRGAIGRVNVASGVAAACRFFVFLEPGGRVGGDIEMHAGRNSRWIQGERKRPRVRNKEG